MPDELVGGGVEKNAVVDTAEMTSALASVAMCAGSLPDDLCAEMCYSENFIKTSTDEMIDIRTDVQIEAALLAEQLAE